MGSRTIDRLIVNSPYEEPSHHWHYDRETRLFDLAEGRRPAGYFSATQGSRAVDDPGKFIEIPLVNRIRARVKDWRDSGYPGVSGVTRRLLQYWTDAEEFESRRFFFCQIEAAETLIWLTEVAAVDKVGLEIPSDGGTFRRLCAKMATGSGKTIVMAMIAAWQILNKVTYAKDKRFSKHILVIAPGLTVKNRLVVLDPAHPDNYYGEFRIVPPALLDKLRRGKVVIRNWYALNWETPEKMARKRGVDKRGVKSDEAYVRGVLGDIAHARNILVINDEAHHAWRVPASSCMRSVAQANVDEATKWVGGLDRIHRVRGIATCYDFSATPCAPSGGQSSEESLFGWIVSDFGLNDAIESGLVKTPRVVVRDDALPDAKTYRSRLYHIYSDHEVRDDLNRKALAEEPLPSLVNNAYHLLGFDWRETARSWEARRAIAPPVMISVANRTETAARIKHAFDDGRIPIDELSDPDRTLHIDSKVLAEAEASDEPIAELVAEQSARKLTRKQKAELLRSQVDTVGQPNKPGWLIQNVISVGMLSEGWDAKNVTHIMGLRAFSSQLLCEQVVGRGLRRTSYDVSPETGLFEPEYVNIFGVPFTFLPHEGGNNGPPPPPPPKTAIHPVAEKARFALSWPNIIRIDHGYRPRLSLDWKALQPLELDASQTASLAELAPIIDGKPDITSIDAIDLQEFAAEYRVQRIVFEVARDMYARMKPKWRGGEANLLGQLVRLMEKFMDWDGLTVTPPLFNGDGLRRRLILALNMSRLFRHIWSSVELENAETLQPVFDADRPILSTGAMRTWFTGRPCDPARHSHINFCVHDSTWEATTAFALDHAQEVEAWAKNDHLGFEVFYVDQGVVRKYRPDFLIRLSSGDMLVLETKGRERERDRVKHRFLDEWVRAVNEHGGFGRWSWAVSKKSPDISGILAKHYGCDTACAGGANVSADVTAQAPLQVEQG